MNILLVDDEPLALQELEDVVSNKLPMAQLFSFTKAQEAMDFAKNMHIDIAFLDIQMRFFDGISMAKVLMKYYPHCNIIFCTAYTDYALDALNSYCSGYLLKPISEEKLSEAMEHLRYPLVENNHRVKIRCFGNFEVLCDGQPILFKYNKSKELLAYLTDRDGAEATTQEIMAAIFEESKSSYFSNIRLDLLNTLEKLGVSEVVSTSYGKMRIVKEAVDCDYFDYLDGKNNGFNGEYMTQYSFAEATCGKLNRN